MATIWINTILEALAGWRLCSTIPGNNGTNQTVWWIERKS